MGMGGLTLVKNWRREANEAAAVCVCVWGCQEARLPQLPLLDEGLEPPRHGPGPRPPPRLPAAARLTWGRQAYRLLAAEQYAQGWDYPLHLGVTEVVLARPRA